MLQIKNSGLIWWRIQMFAFLAITVFVIGTEDQGHKYLLVWLVQIVAFTSMKNHRKYHNNSPDVRDKTVLLHIFLRSSISMPQILTAGTFLQWLCRFCWNISCCLSWSSPEIHDSSLLKNICLSRFHLLFSSLQVQLWVLSSTWMTTLLGDFFEFLILYPTLVLYQICPWFNWFPMFSLKLMGDM